MQLGGRDGVVSIHIAETIYFLAILFLQSIYDLHSQVYSFDLRIQRHINIVLSVFTSWLDSTLTICIYTCSNLGIANTALLEIGCSYYGLFAASVSRIISCFLSLNFFSVKDLYHQSRRKEIVSTRLLQY